MARGDFLGDLSSGIFQRQRELQQQQETQDFAKQEGLVRMLAGLVDKVEDPSMLMGHIWDTMGIKKSSGGKGLRGFLDAFSGMPNRSMEDQLGTKFRELTGSFMGADEAKGIRGRAYVAEKGLPYPGGYAPPTPGPFTDKAKADAEMLKKRIVFRDPRQEELEKIRQKAEAQSVLMQDRLNLQNTYNSREKELTRQHQIDMEGLKTENKRGMKVGQLATHLFMSDPDRYGGDLNQAHQEAATKLVQMTDAQLEDLLSKPILRRKMGRKIDAELGVGGEKRMTPYQKSQLENETVRTLGGIINDFGPARQSALEEEKAYDILAKPLEEFATTKGVTYSRDTGGFVGDPNKVIAAKALANASGMLKQASEAREKFLKARGVAETQYTRLKDKKYESYLDIGPSWREEVSISKGRARKAQPPPKATLPTRGTLGNVGMGSGVREIDRGAGERSIDIRGKGQVMPGMIVPSKIDPNIKYRITYVHPNGNLAYGVPVKDAVTKPR